MPRMWYGCLFLLVLLTEIYIAVFVHDAFVRPFAGDVLVVILLYFFVRAIRPRQSGFLPIYLFFFSAAVEFGQFFHLVELLGLEDFLLARIVIGSTFDWMDIVCYFWGMAFLLLWQAGEKRVFGKLS